MLFLSGRGYWVLLEGYRAWMNCSAAQLACAGATQMDGAAPSR
ncbi:Uncharacterised protein [Bordetella pertussis]|nr:Uncharacterised protein [Bordetella pertussis]